MVRATLRAGAFDYLGKPCSIDVLARVGAQPRASQRALTPMAPRPYRGARCSSSEASVGWGHSRPRRPRMGRLYGAPYLACRDARVPWYAKAFGAALVAYGSGGVAIRRARPWAIGMT